MSEPASERQPNQAARFLAEATELHRKGKLDAAIAGYLKVLDCDPEVASAYNNMGVALRTQGRYAAAAACYKRAIALQPTDAPAHSNLGNALRAIGRLDESEACHRRALEMDPENIEAQYNLGLALKDKGQTREALDCLNNVLHHKPDHVDAHWDRALTWLVSGDLLRGFAEYEWRWRLAENPARTFEKPLWSGSPLDGRTILLHAEQGMGDTLQFARFAPIVAAQGGKVVLECQGPLADLLGGLDGVSAISVVGSPLPAFDCHAPLLSLPRIFGTTLETIPAAAGYLSWDGPNQTFSDIAGRPGLKVGIVWAGKPSHRNDRHRSVGLAPFIELFGSAGVSFFSLQVGPRAGDPASLGCAGLVRDLTPRIKSFADTAAALGELDLVITVDTALAHLAGAMGKEAWVMLPYAPDWRWLLERTDSPWYESVTLYRQRTPGDWDDVFTRIQQDLSRRIETPA